MLHPARSTGVLLHKCRGHGQDAHATNVAECGRPAHGNHASSRALRIKSSSFWDIWNIGGHFHAFPSFHGQCHLQHPPSHTKVPATGSHRSIADLDLSKLGFYLFSLIIVISMGAAYRTANGSVSG